MAQHSIRSVSLSEVQTLLSWAADEGWNPGVDDAALFHAVDPDGFLMLFEGSTPVAGISVVRTGPQQGFLGLYICHPDYRGKGNGFALWTEGMRRLQSCTVGLDGVVEQQDNYRRSGFEYAYRNVRFSGTSDVSELISSSQGLCRSFRSSDLVHVTDMDQHVHGHRRSHLLSCWTQDSPTRTSLVAESGGSLRGFGAIRQCLHGHKVGPLIADSNDTALQLVSALVRSSGATDLILDVPEPNMRASELARSMGLLPSFETARMYRGSTPDYQLDKLYGVTSFELG